MRVALSGARQGALTTILTLVVGAAMLCAFLAGALSHAWADEAEDAQQAVDAAQASLDEAEQQMQDITVDCDTLKQEADDLQVRIDEGTNEALATQQAVIDGRKALGVTAAHEYRNGSSMQSVVDLLLGATDFSELMRNLSYLDVIMQYQSDEIEAQRERSQQLEKLIEGLNDQKDAQQEKLAQLEAKKAEAEQLVASASAQLQNAQDDQAARLAALQQAAEQMATGGAEGNPAGGEDALSSVDPTGWSTGVASAYGGSTDPGTPNPGTTATGAVCDDYSMGVAIPMAWSNFRSYFGRTVEISYGGMTVFAPVNDCGGMGGGSRSLDLQPGVWKAFGFSSCNDWGLRTVNYRFL